MTLALDVGKPQRGQSRDRGRDEQRSGGEEFGGDYA